MDMPEHKLWKCRYGAPISVFLTPSLSNIQERVYLVHADHQNIHTPNVLFR